MNFVRAGCEVATASSAHEAMSLCAERPFDAILLMSECIMECEQCPFASQCILLPKPFTPKQAIALVADGLKSFSELR
jgi:hypothetical protein